MTREETRSWEGIGARWTLRRPQRTWRAHSDAVNLRLLKRWNPCSDAGRVLKTDAFDEAFGDGLVSWIAGRSCGAVLIDVSLPTLEAARARAGGAELVCADARHLPFRFAAFDGAVSLSTLDHFGTREEIARGIEELGRVLRPGGTAVVTLDNPGNPIVTLRNRLPESWLRRTRLLPYPVGATMGRDDLVAALERAGFAVREVGAILHGPRVAAVAAARLVDLLDSRLLRKMFLRFAGALEHLGETPFRFRTGYFVAARAERH